MTASEIIVKAMLWGQYAFSFIPYEGVFNVDKLNLLLSLKEPNIKGRKWWLKNLNNFVWNNKNKTFYLLPIYGVDFTMVLGKQIS